MHLSLPKEEIIKQLEDTGLFIIWRIVSIDPMRQKVYHSSSLCSDQCKPSPLSS